MSGILVVVLVFFALAGGLGAVAYFTYQKKLRRAKAIERGLKMVPILIHLPPPSSDTASGARDIREVMREKTAQAEVLYNLLAGTATEGFKSNFYGQRHVALELIVIDGLVHFFAAVPVAMVSTVKKAIITAYPGARLEETEDHNIFNQEGRLAATLGGEMVLRAESAFPIATYEQLERDPMEAVLTTVSALEKHDGVAIQIMLRPAGTGWTKRSIKLADDMRKGRKSDLKFSAMDLAKAVVKAPEQRREEERMKMGGGADVSQLALSQVERIEEKTKHPGFEVLVRVIVSTGSVARSQQLLRDIATAFALFEAPGLNGFKFLPALDVQGLVTAFIFRFFPPELKSNVLSSAELATLFHLPDSQFTPSTSVERQQSKQVDGPVQMPTVGLLFGYNEFRGVKKEIRLSPEDRRRHTYILGQTGTGKSTMLENLAVQDMLSGNGFAFIDPHGDSAEKLLSMVPKERAEDVIYFNPADSQYPLGLNLFEFTDPAQKDFIVQETINMLYKLYDPGHTGIIGPRYEHWYRNAALTLMADPNGSTFIEVPKVFTDTDYLKQKFKYLKDPTVIDFWTKEMGQTSDYHKSEMLGWFVSKFGAFQNNEIMRNILGQTKSAFDIRDVMDKKKILIVNLSKGRIGELNSQLLGMIFVIKFQAAAMSRANVPEDQRPDFALYVDEFQNFATDSFASILSEARKYRLNLIVANQFIGQLTNEIRDAVFGNIGTIVAHRMGPDDAEFMVKQFAPVFDASDLVNIPNYNAAMRLMIGGLPSQPFSIKNSAPLGNANAELGLAIKQLSAAKYGHDKAVVEADILDRFSGHTVVAGMAPAAPGGVAPAPAAVPAPGVNVAAPAPVPAPMVAPVVAPAPVMPLATPVAAPAPISAPVVVSEPVAPVAATADPAVAVATATAPVAPVLMGMAAVPPAIGAPPIGAPPVDLPTEASRVEPAAQAPAAVPVSEPVSAPASAPVSPVAPRPAIMDLATAAAPVFAPAVQAAPAPVPAGGLIAPPPIGAPPVDLPAAAQTGAPAKSPINNTLSFTDITGGKQPVASAPVTVLADPQPSPLDDVPLLGSPMPEPPAAEAVLPPVLVGDGQPLGDDPYANIDIMGAPAPVAPGVPVVPGVEAPAPVRPQVPVSDGTPLADDPYGQIDILGESAASEPAAAAPVPVVPVMSPAAVNPPAELWPAPVLSQPAPRVAPTPVVAPVPVAPPVEPMPMEPSMQPAPVEPEPIEQALPEPIAPPQPVTALVPAPLPPVEPRPIAQVSPVATAPLPVRTPLPVAIEPTEPEPRAVEPEPRLAAMEPDFEPEPRLAPEPMQVTPVVSEPVSAESAPTEPLIHFVDPAAETLLNSPDVPEPDGPNGAPSMSGLPEGVHLVDPNVPAAATPPVVASNEVPAAQADLAAKLSGIVPTPVPAPVPAPVQSPAPAEPTLVAVGDLVKPLIPDEAKEEMQEARAHIAAIAATPPKPIEVEAPGAAKPIEVVKPEVKSEVKLKAPKEEIATLPKPEPKMESKFELQPEVKPEPKVEPVVEIKPVPVIEPVKPVAAEAVSEPAVVPEPIHEPVAEAPAVEVQSAVAEPVAQTPEPPKPMTGADQIQNVEHQIDDLLSVSLIHSDSTPGHHRLPEPITIVKSEDESGVDLELNAGRPSATAGAKEEHPAAVHHGLKVIQPLEPIVPPKERFAKELAEMNAQQQPAPAPVVKAAPAPVVAAKPTPAPTPVVAATPPPPKPVAPKPEPKPQLPMVPAPQLAPEPLVMQAAVPAPTFDATFDEGLPQAQSLAADDVAKVRAEQAAHPAPSEAMAPVPEPELPAAPAPAAIVKHEEHMLPDVQKAEDKPEEKAEDKPEVSEKKETETSTSSNNNSKRKRHRGGRDKPAERIESAEEAEHNQPSAAAVEAAPLTGKLILPSGEKPVMDVEKPKEAKPKKLAPGEVYVDETGNVIIGE